MGRGLGPVTYFSNFGTLISGTGEGTSLKFCTCIEGKGPDIEQKMQYWSKQVVT